jgi:hypothetical protein
MPNSKILPRTDPTLFPRPKFVTKIYYERRESLTKQCALGPLWYVIAPVGPARVPRFWKGILRRAQDGGQLPGGRALGFEKEVGHQPDLLHLSIGDSEHFLS